MPLPKIILASTSPRRRELLQELKLEFEVVPSHSDEIEDEQLTANEVAQVNAFRKAMSVAEKHFDAFVIGADTVVTLNGRLFGKPADLADAARMIGQLQGHTHQVVTGVCLVRLSHHRQHLFSDLTDVTFHSLNAEQIQAYLTSINPLDKAGAYAIQENGHRIVKAISGSYSNVVGLPLERLRAELEAWSLEER